MRRLVVSLVVASVAMNAAGYLGSFDPQPLRSEVTITFVDSQIPGPQCFAEQPTFFAPLQLTALGCAIYDKGLLILPINPGIGWLNAAQVFALPDALLGHEFRHLFDGDYHPIALPYVERVRRPSRAAGSVVIGQQHGGDLRADEGARPDGDGHAERLHQKDGAATIPRCEIVTVNRDVSYIDLGGMVRLCAR